MCVMYLWNLGERLSAVSSSTLHSALTNGKETGPGEYISYELMLRDTQGPVATQSDISYLLELGSGN